jgi:hypothetical protein
MGLDIWAVQLLCAAKAIGVDFADVTMIGRQDFHPLSPAMVDVLASALGIRSSLVAELNNNKYGEPFFALLGAARVSSIDVSAYEGATYVHDLNMALPDHLRGQFSLVFDGGSIEHIFNVPAALKGCMEMVRLGGHFAQVTVANNFMGHGFWQISPELIFRVFTPANGYRLEAVLLREVVQGGAWYSVRNPSEILRRVELRNDVPTYLCTIAKRISLEDIFVEPPQQSDFVAEWGRSGWSRESRPEDFSLRLNSAAFLCVSEADLLRGKIAQFER